MIKTIFLFSTLLIFCVSCGKTPGIDDTISEIKLSSETIDADGSSTDTISVVLNNKNASADRRMVLFTVSGGTLNGSVHDSLKVTADFYHEQLYAKAILTAPFSAASNIVVTAAPAYNSSNADYTRSKTIVVNKIGAAGIHLEPSSLAIASNFISTDTFVATIKGPGGQKVSAGTKVVFESDFTSNPTEYFRAQRLSVDANSQVMALYSIPSARINSTIKITVTILKDNGDKSMMSDMVTLTVTQ